MKKEKYIRFCINWSKPYIKKYKFQLLFLFLLIVISTCLNLVQVNFVQRSIDAVLSRDKMLLVKILFLFITVTLVRLIQIFLYGHYSEKTSLSMNKDLKDAFINKVLNSKIGEIKKWSSGDLNTRNNSDIPNALGFIRQVFSNFILSPFMAVGGFIYLLIYNWKLSLLVFLPLPILAYLLNLMSDRSSQIYKRLQKINSDYTEEIYDIIHGEETIKAYNMQSYKLKKIRAVIFKLLKEGNAYGKNDAITLALILSVTYLPSIIALIYGAFLITKGEITVSLLFAYSQLIPTICSPTISLFGAVKAIKNSYHSMKRVDEVMNIESERYSGNDFVLSKDTVIKFDKVHFGYDSDSKVLKDFELQLDKGKCIGIVGSSGAGKTTIVHLVCGLYEVEQGSISIFDHDIKDWNLEQLRSKIAYVSQETYILPGTIYENVRFGNLDATKEEVENAIQMAGLQTFIDSLKDGHDTVLSEDGDNLSGGQRQRLSIARAFLRNASIYIFDEPTASLDPETEEQVLREIESIIKFKNIAAIIISHNIKTLRNCDEIYFIREGTVIEKGSINELTDKKGEFYNQFYECVEVSSL